MSITHNKVASPDIVHSKANSVRLTEFNSPFSMEAVIICDKYHDFLVHTLPTNKFLFNKLVVVTTPEDLATQRICEFHHVQCLKTDSLRSRWKEFCKGSAINEGLAELKLDGWVAHMDADIYLPPQTRILIEQANLDPSMIYGIDRFIVKGREAWDEFRDYPDLQHECEAYIHPGAFPLGTRVMHPHAGGYVPIGFFQLWHPGVSGVNDYPAEHTNAGRGDTVHAQRWARSQRALLPEIIGYHLESDNSAMAANWNGRTTDPFKRRLTK